MLNRRGIDRNIDWVTFSLYLALVMVGWIMIYATTYQEGQAVFSLSSLAGKQLLWTVISFSAFAVTMALDWKFWQTFAYPIYALTLLSLVGVLIFGVRIKGQLSWYSIAGFTIQPAEFAKFGTCLAMAAYLSTAGVNLKTIRSQLIAGSLVAAPIFLILLQPDTGSAIVFLSFLIVLYRHGLNSVYYILGGFAVAMLIIGILYEDYRFLWILLLSISCIWLGAEMTDKRSRW
ncbi:MAG: rod shape-determining protein RodA [Bacteroidota bacterium]